MTTVLEEFRLQSRFCAEFGSRFTSELLARGAGDIEAGGSVARLIEGWPGNPRADAVSLRWTGALHAAALTGRDAALAAEYPGARDDWSMERVWPVVMAFLQREEAWVRDFMRSPPQTNETARSTGLAAGFMWLAQRAPEPFHLFELGASAGLNLNWDRFAYAYPAWGRAGVSGPFMPTEVRGATLPPWRDIAIASRAACDQNPLNAANADDRLRLRAYVWADQTARLERLNAALDLAQATGVKVEKADAAVWTRRALAGELPVGTSVIYHSVFLQYPPQDVREAILDTIAAAGARTSPGRRLAWLSFEPESVVAGPHGSARYVLHAAMWDEGRRSDVTLAEVDPHGRHLTWLV
jgi:hypothetical protein